MGSARYRAVLVLDRAVGTDQDKKFVLVLKPDSTVEYRPVQVGRLVDGMRIVTAGLKGGERIVINGLQRVRPGMKVAPTVAPMAQDSTADTCGALNMNFSRFFIDRPIFAAVLSIVVFLAGGIAMFALPISEYPEVVPPSIVVTAVYPGANPRVLSEAVATPLEEQINGVENMLYMSSQATSDGVLTTTVTFRIGTDPDIAQVQVQNRVAQALPRLPEEVRQSGVTTVKSSPDLTMVVHLVSPDNRYDIVYLRNYALLQVKDVHRTDPRRGPGPGLRRRRLRHADLARSPEGRRPRPVGRRRDPRDPGAERAGGRRRRGRPADAGEGGLPAQRQHARPAGGRERVRGDHHQDRRATAS